MKVDRSNIPHAIQDNSQTNSSFDQVKIACKALLPAICGAAALLQLEESIYQYPKPIVLEYLSLSLKCSKVLVLVAGCSYMFFALGKSRDKKSNVDMQSRETKYIKISQKDYKSLILENESLKKQNELFNMQVVGQKTPFPT